MPSLLKISILRQLVTSIFGHFVVVSLRSTSRHGTLFVASCRAAIRPEGPAPTIRTGVDAGMDIFSALDEVGRQVDNEEE
jgi:hypothetical protein